MTRQPYDPFCSGREGAPLAQVMDIGWFRMVVITHPSFIITN